MRKLVFLVLLASCAQEPQEPTQIQLALLGYYADKCEKQGVDPNNIPAMKGCIWITYQKDVKSGLYGTNQLGDVMQGMGSVYETAGRKSQQTCSTSPDYRGGFTTTCY
jgi:hypothetical protein